MSKDTFKIRSQKAFWELSIEFADELGKSFPNCSDTKDLILWGKNVIVGDDKEEENGIINWYNAMLEPLKKTKYSKAVERITGSPPTVYHAVIYKDHESMSLSSSSASLRRLNISEKMNDSSFTDEKKELFWKYMNRLNKYAEEFVEKDFPRVPTREEISENIKKNKQGDTASSQPSMLKGFNTSLSVLCEMRNCKNVYDLSSDSELSKMFSKWVEVSKEEIDGKTISVLCKERKEEIIPKLSEVFPEIKWEEPIEESQWVVLIKLFSFCDVGEAIPSQMMGKIENMASKLANDIMSGKKDMGSMDLQSIGEEVLSQCNSADMSHFADNIDKILPAINNLR
tara:strand:+ start:1326 stop:2348 length:1023 start_codon:yes stop_codon:yes gene_type:complete